MQIENDNIMFTIIIPAFNVKNFIEKCVKSVICQTYGSYEVIIVDDGSTDGTEDLCDLLQQKYGSIKVIHQKNAGLSAARNTGIRNANGKYLIFVDSDDYIDNMALEKFANIIEQYEPEVIVADAWRISGQNKTRKTPPKNNLDGVMNGIKFMNECIMQKAFSVCVPFNVYLKSLILDNDLMFKIGILHEDLWWTPQVFSLAKRVIYFDYIFYYNVEREGSITKSYTTKNISDMMETYYDLQNVVSHEAKRILNDFLAQNYMSACFLARNDIKVKKYVVDRKFPIKNTIFIKNKIKSIIFFISPNLYISLDRICKYKVF